MSTLPLHIFSGYNEKLITDLQFQGAERLKEPGLSALRTSRKLLEGMVGSLLSFGDTIYYLIY